MFLATDAQINTDQHGKIILRSEKIRESVAVEYHPFNMISLAIFMGTLMYFFSM